MLALASLQRLNAARLAARCVAVRCKSTTGIVGLPVVEDARDSLEEHYGKVLEAVQVIPESAEFRSLIEKTVNHRLGLLKSELVDEELEQELGRQLEEEIKLMQDELKLIPKMAGVHASVLAMGVCDFMEGNDMFVRVWEALGDIWPGPRTA